ncbi:unnamed protein product [Amoebophrya sp. A25]|nr:unnamed protein product [Amoebophrya sp. A25]|eukprot:GSA25T00017732001.1
MKASSEKEQDEKRILAQEDSSSQTRVGTNKKSKFSEKMRSSPVTISVTGKAAVAPAQAAAANAAWPPAGTPPNLGATITNKVAASGVPVAVASVVSVPVTTTTTTTTTTEYGYGSIAKLVLPAEYKWVNRILDKLEGLLSLYKAERDATTATQTRLMSDQQALFESAMMKTMKSLAKEMKSILIFLVRREIDSNFRFSGPGSESSTQAAAPIDIRIGASSSASP